MIEIVSDADKLIADEKKTESLLVPSNPDLLMVPGSDFGSPYKKETGFDSDSEQEDWDKRDKRK